MSTPGEPTTTPPRPANVNGKAGTHTGRKSRRKPTVPKNAVSLSTENSTLESSADDSAPQQPRTTPSRSNPRTTSHPVSEDTGAGEKRRPKRTNKPTHVPNIPNESTVPYGRHSKSASTSALHALDGTTHSYADSSDYDRATPVKQAYAGPTFHASPAASSLPIPKLATRSTPHVPRASSMSVPPASAPHGSLDHPSLQTRESESPSPLDMLFQAHKAQQQARGHTQSPLKSDGTAMHATGPSPGVRNRDALLREVDGAGDPSYSDSDGHEPPSFNERMRLAMQRPRSDNTAPHAHPQHANQTPPQDPRDEQDRLDKTLALKRLLALPDNETPTAQPHSLGAVPGSNVAPDFTGTRPNNAFYAPPQTDSFEQVYPYAQAQRMHHFGSVPPPPVQDLQAGADVRAMEDSLRRILKLAPG